MTVIKHNNNTNVMMEELDTRHHIKGLRPALHIMSELGFSREECLDGTNISLALLDNPDLGISLEQEFAFYRRLLTLTQDPLIGLKLGQAYRLESYGVFGYAILSAPTLGDALAIACQYDSLSFSHFKITLEITEGLALFKMQKRSSIDPDLLTLFEDRDCSAILSGALSALGQAFPIHYIKLMHDNSAHKNTYEALFNCPVSFKHTHLEFAFNAAVLEQCMPLRDPDTAKYCRQQCDRLLRKQEKSQSWQELVRKQLHLKEHIIRPCIKQVAKALHTSERSLRRRLSDEGTSFQLQVNEVCYEQAKVLLKRDLSLEEIAHNLGYSEAANFSHAFKRWAGISPTQYRQQLNKGGVEIR